MTSDVMFRAIGDIADRYVDEAAQPVRAKRRSIRIAWVAAAACVALAIATLPFVHTTQSVGGDSNVSLLATVGSRFVGEAGSAGSTGLDGAEGAAINTGVREPDPDVPPTAEALAMYDRLMASFEAEYGGYPDWYGGAYFYDGDYMIVNMTDEFAETLTDKSMYIQIQQWAGSDRIGFGGTSVSLNELNELKAQVEALDELSGVDGWECGVNVLSGQVKLVLPTDSTAVRDAIARLDPTGERIELAVLK